MYCHWSVHGQYRKASKTQGVIKPASSHYPVQMCLCVCRCLCVRVRVRVHVRVCLPNAFMDIVSLCVLSLLTPLFFFFTYLLSLLVCVCVCVFVCVYLCVCLGGGSVPLLYLNDHSTLTDYLCTQTLLYTVFPSAQIQNHSNMFCMSLSMQKFSGWCICLDRYESVCVCVCGHVYVRLCVGAVSETWTLKSLCATGHLIFL